MNAVLSPHSLHKIQSDLLRKGLDLAQAIPSKGLKFVEAV
jgi:hypothetical protein